MSIVLPGIPSSVQSLIQENTLKRKFDDALLPEFIFRAECKPEGWEANVGDVQLFTRRGLIAPVTTPLQPGTDPKPASYSTEQWRVEADQYGLTLDTHMPTSRTALAPTVLSDTHTLGINAGQSMNRVCRNNLYTAYLGGEGYAVGAAGIGAQQVQVSTLNGFSDSLVNGRLTPISAANPLPVSFGGAAADNFVTQVVPDDLSRPFGSGTLVLSTPLTAAVAVRELVTAGTATLRQRVGGGASVDAITGANILTLNSIIAAVARLRSMNVKPHDDGHYHVHLDPVAESQIYADDHWQRLHESLPEHHQYAKLSIGKAVDCIFFRNTEVPSQTTVNAASTYSTGAGSSIGSDEIGAEIVNDGGIPIRRTLVTGREVLIEKYIDESSYISEAGVQGKIGAFSIVNDGVAVMTDRIRFTMRAPQDRLGQIIAQTWSWSGDFGVPSDQLTGDDARFKRAVAIEHA